ncbi:PREDICTED: uncharacterized protein LOC105119721 isoform X2 [Populus euphratica]|uniref:Uncharacterized protein LOC105119721 isoform X2 n=1 Tax=Populus euphratica TaxID=75702 RepID=A0AAJ6XF36_POPEU|nr:PREDICTED: uncharacterized protein LOC105119721 isoform X2 [Populus euphratica]
MAWATTFLLKVFESFFYILSWPSFTLVCPLYASFLAVKSDSCSKNQQCLTFWVLFALFTILEQALSKLLLWLPFWPYVKGVATVLLVIPYFGGASYIYMYFVRPYLSENSMKWINLSLPRNNCFPSWRDNDFVDVADTNMTGDGHEELEKSVFQIFEPNHDIVEEEIAGSTSPKKVQKERSCALCLFSTSSEKCLKKHFQGKKHETNEENLRAEELARDTSKSLPVKRKTRMVFLGNLVNLETWSDLLGPVARSIRWCQWKRPDFGWIKLNTDGSIDSENAGIGGLFRDYEGNAICGFVSKASGHDIFLVELWAIWRGLVLALDLHIQVVWVESDSLSVVNTINRQQPYSGKADACLKRIWHLLKMFKKHKVSHSWRETNRAADYLAKMVVERDDVVLWPADFPTSLNNIIKDDAQGKVYCRR